MINQYTLSFNSHELDKAYQVWIKNMLQYRMDITLAIVIIYFGILIIQFSIDGDLLLQISSIISIVLEITIYFFQRKYAQYKELLINLNLTILGINCELIRLFCSDTNQWYYGNHFTILKLVLFIQGNSLLQQTFIFLACSMISVYQQNSIPLNFGHSITTILLIIFRHAYELMKKENFLSSQSKEQYENILQNILPSWVVSLKLDKIQSLLMIDIINKNLSQKFEITDSTSFREFLRSLIVLPIDYESSGNQQQIKLENEIIKVLKITNEDHSTQKYQAYLDLREKKKYWFTITQIYFKGFEPLMFLLFEELKEDKYETYTNQLELRNQTSYSHAKISLHLITSLIQLTEQIKQLSYSDIQLMQTQRKQILVAYMLYNINYNVYTFSQISNSILKYDISQFNIDNIIQKLCDDLYLNKKHQKLSSIQLIQMIKSDKAKLISIIINLVEFVKILLSIIYSDSNILYQASPLGNQIQISSKQSKQQDKCIILSISHPKLSLHSTVIDKFCNVDTQIDDKKRNWNTKNHLNMITQMTQAYQYMIDHYQNRIQMKSFSLIDTDYPFPRSSKNMIGNLDTRSQNSKCAMKFDTLGYPLAQYLVSQLGPSNRFLYQTTIKTIDQQSQFSPTQGGRRTKIQFLFYQDLSSFKNQLYAVEQNQFVDMYLKKRKYSSYELSQKLLQFQQACSPRRQPTNSELKY